MICDWYDFLIMSVYLYGLYGVLFHAYRTTRRLFPPLRRYLPSVQARPIFRAEKLR
jgi:hypothetical protein